MHYVSDRLSVKGVMTIIVSEQPALIEKMIDPIYGIGTDTLFQILTKLLSSILSKHPEFYDEYGAQFEEIASVIGYDLEHRIPSGQKTPTAGQVVSKLEQLCEIMNECKIRSLISIDNFDRLNAEIALVFLKSNYAQPIFELLERSGATILLTAKSEWLVGSRRAQLLRQAYSSQRAKPRRMQDSRQEENRQLAGRGVGHRRGCHL